MSVNAEKYSNNMSVCFWHILSHYAKNRNTCKSESKKLSGKGKSVKHVDGVVLSEDEETQDRWKHYFVRLEIGAVGPSDAQSMLFLNLYVCTTSRKKLRLQWGYKWWFEWNKTE